MGFFKKIKKFFKKVVSSKIFKIVGAVVGVAAAVFTAGASLGLGFAAGGWGAAAGSVSSALGLTGTLGNIVTGAITAAGYGSLMGGATSAIMGGDILEGMAGGALGGALTGGVLGGLGMSADPLGGVFDDAPTQAATGSAATGGNALELAPTGFDGAPVKTGLGFGGQASPQATQGLGFGTGGLDAALSGTPTATGGANVAGQAAAAGQAGTQSAIGDLGASAGGWLDRNMNIIGPTLTGLGKGLLEGGAAEDEMKYRREERQDLIDQNTGLDFRRRREDTPLPKRYPTGAERRQSANTPWVRWDPETKRMVWSDRQREGGMG